MPKAHIVPDAKIDLTRLRSELVREWTHPGQESEPVIIEEPSGFEGYLRLYVIWNEWNSLSQRDRSTIIMRAFEDTHDKEQLLNVTVAMGLTPTEADRMGIRYQIEG